MCVHVGWAHAGVHTLERTTSFLLTCGSQRTTSFFLTCGSQGFNLDSQDWQVLLPSHQLLIALGLSNFKICTFYRYQLLLKFWVNHTFFPSFLYFIPVWISLSSPWRHCFLSHYAIVMRICIILKINSVKASMLKNKEVWTTSEFLTAKGRCF